MLLFLSLTKVAHIKPLQWGVPTYKSISFSKWFPISSLPCPLSAHSDQRFVTANDDGMLSWQSWVMVFKGAKVMIMAANILVKSFWDSHFQDPIQFLADYLMKNNKKEESDKEDTEDTKTDVWWITVEIVLGRDDGTQIEDWRLNTICSVFLQWEHNLCSSKLISFLLLNEGLG